MAKSAAFNIAIVPSPQIIRRAIMLSGKIEPYGGMFVLNKRLYSTHVTLYMAEVPLSNLATLRREVKIIAAEQKPLPFKAIMWRQNRDGYIDVAYKKTKELDRLQKNIVERLNPLRRGLLRTKDRARLNIGRGIEKRNIVWYGYRGVGTKFEPHLTLSRLKTYRPAITPKRDPTFMSFTATEIGIFYLGEHGTCKQLVAKFKFSKNP